MVGVGLGLEVSGYKKSETKFAFLYQRHVCLVIIITSN